MLTEQHEVEHGIKIQGRAHMQAKLLMRYNINRNIITLYIYICTHACILSPYRLCYTCMQPCAPWQNE